MTTASASPRPTRNRKARQATRLAIESLLQILVRREHFGAVEKRHQGDAQDHHGERQAEVDLDEAHAIDVALPRGAHERDRARLRRHHREPDGIPGHGALREEEIFEAFVPPAGAVPDENDEREIQRDDEPVEGVQHQRA